MDFEACPDEPDSEKIRYANVGQDKHASAPQPVNDTTSKQHRRSERKASKARPKEEQYIRSDDQRPPTKNVADLAHIGTATAAASSTDDPIQAKAASLAENSTAMNGKAGAMMKLSSETSNTVRASATMIKKSRYLDLGGAAAAASDPCSCT